MEVSLKGNGNTALELLDAEGKQVATATVRGNGVAVMNLDNPHKWTAETPYLYTLRAALQGSGEVIPIKVGFRKIELKNAQVLVTASLSCSREPTVTKWILITVMSFPVSV